MSLDCFRFKRGDSFGFLVALYFMLSFFWVTYSSNAYIVFSLFLFVCLFFSGVRFSLLISVVVFFICLCYFYTSGVTEAYRFLKTFLIFFPIVYVCRFYRLSSPSYLDVFFRLCILLVFIEFAFYSYFGVGFMPNTTSAIGFGLEFLRYRSLFEDSNFFSYAILAYIFYRKIIFGCYDVFFVIALFLSFSVSAIFAFMALAIFYSLFDSSYFIRRCSRMLFAFLIFSIVFVYFYLVMNLTGLMSGVDSEFWRFKLFSLSIRFDLQSSAIEYMLSNGSTIWGYGAGSARLMSEGGFNFHNTYLQILFEMGFVTLFFVLSVLIYLYSKIDVRFLPVYSVILLLGLVMEVYYFPLLVFVFYLSCLKPREG